MGNIIRDKKIWQRLPEKQHKWEVKALVNAKPKHSIAVRSLFVWEQANKPAVWNMGVHTRWPYGCVVSRLCTPGGLMGVWPHGCAHWVASWLCTPGGLVAVHTGWPRGCAHRVASGIPEEQRKGLGKQNCPEVFVSSRKKKGVFLTLLTIVTNIKTRINCREEGSTGLTAPVKAEKS